MVTCRYNHTTNSAGITSLSGVAGRLLREGDKTYAYGYLDKILSVQENGKRTAAFDYHVDGQIASATHRDKSENFLWDGLALIHRGKTSFINEPYLTGGNPILSGKSGVMFNDMLGNTLGTKGESYSPVTMTAFGETADKSAMFTGKPYIGDLGYAFLFRNYRPDQGKWNSADPLGYPDGWNNLAYCNNNTTVSYDHLGGVQGYALDAQIIGYDPIYGTPLFSYSIVTCETSRWGNFDFSAHYYVGNGQERTLQSMGLANSVWSIIERDVINRSGGLLDQLDQLAISLIDKSQTSGTATMSYNTRNAYDFQEASWPIRMGTLQTFSRGSVSWALDSENEVFDYNFSTSSSFYFTDTFSDPLNLETLGLPRMDMPLSAPYLIAGQWSKILTGNGSIPE